MDPNITRRIVDLVGPPSHPVLEIGVGTATLSSELLAAGHRLLGYEVDARLRPLIDEVIGADPRAEIRFEDVMRVDLNMVLGAGRWVMASNLPYEVGTPLVLDALREVAVLERFVVMVQREVAERMVAGPGDPAYGLPSVVVSLHANARIAFRVPHRSFCRPPGSVLRLWCSTGRPRLLEPMRHSDWRPPGSGNDARCSANLWRASSEPLRLNSRPPGSTRGRVPRRWRLPSGCVSPR